ncbi:MAG TPA: ABC transporter permease [Candidatus Sulfotelmatobacter sp.]|nr:ABC transporter permease [Candidatus Sulfotelmatobacter sp.]
MTPASSATERGGRRLNWRQVRILYLRELRGAFRERTIVLNSILIPVFLYPFLLWLALTGMTFVMGQTEDFRSRVVVPEWPQGQAKLRHRLERNERVQLLETRDAASEIENRIKEGEIDALVEFLPATNGGAALAGNFLARITFNQAKERSVAAKERLTELIERYRGEWLKREAAKHGLDAAAWQGFTMTTRNLASKKQMGSFILGLIAPIIFVVMVAIGCFYPAVDALAGERERNTWETLMSTAASRLSLMTAKYLYVASLGALAGMLNLLAVMLTLRPIFGPLLDRAGQTLECSIPLTALPVMLVAGILLAGFIAAGMMLFATFARTFKEGQAMVTPFYMLIMVPVMFLQVPGLQFSVPLACVPIVNITLMVREALSGTFHWAPMGVTLLVSLLLIALSIRLATFILQFEDVMVGSYNGSFFKFLKQHALNPAKSPKGTPE